MSFMQRDDWRFGPEPVDGLENLLQLLSNILSAYQFTITLILVAVIVFSVVSYMILRWPVGYGAVRRRNLLYRAVLGLVGTFAMIPIVRALAWLAVGYSNPETSMTRVAPQVELPQKYLFGQQETHPLLVQVEASKDPIEGILTGILTLQTTTFAAVAALLIVGGVVVMVVASRWSAFPVTVGRRSTRRGLVLMLVVFLLPMVMTTAAWLATGSATAGASVAQDLSGTPFTTVDDFSGCVDDGWTARDGSATPRPVDGGEGCYLRIQGTATKTYELADVPLERSVVRVATSDTVTVTATVDGAPEVNQTITRTRRFVLPMGDNVSVSLSGQHVDVHSVTVGVSQPDDPYVVTELGQTGAVAREGISQSVTVYNIAAAETIDPIPVTVRYTGTTVTGNQTSVTMETTVDQLRQETAIDVLLERDLSPNPPVGNVTVRAVAEPGDDEVEWGPNYDNVDEESARIEYANLVVLSSRNRTMDAEEFTLSQVVLNQGTIDNAETSLDSTVYGPDGSVVETYSYSVDSFRANSTQQYQLYYDASRPGEYTIRTTVEDSLFPDGNNDVTTITLEGSDLRTSTTGFNSDVRVGESTTGTVRITNSGTEPSAATSASITVDDGSGELVRSRMVDVPALDPGESATYSMTVPVTSTDDYTVSANAITDEFPAGSSTSTSVTGVGPDFRTNIVAPNVTEGTSANVAVVFSNQGDDYSEATTATVQLTGPDGRVLVDRMVDVRRLEPNEVQQVPIYSEQMTDRGQYDVTVTADVPSRFSGSNASETFSVVYSDVNASVSVSDNSTSTEAMAAVTLSNNGTGPATNLEAEVALVNDSGGLVDRRLVAVEHLPPGESVEIQRSLNATDQGLHTVNVSGPNISNSAGPASRTSYTADWPNLTAGVQANNTTLSGYNVTFAVDVANVGTVSNTPTTANLTVRNSSGAVVHTRRLQIGRIPATVTETVVANVTLPEPETYTARVNVSQPQFPNGTTDTTDPVTVQLPDLELNLTAPDAPKETTHTTTLTVTNTGEAVSDPTTAYIEVINNSSTAAYQSTSIQALAPGESTTVRLERSYTEPDSYTARGTIATDPNEAGTVRTSQFTIYGVDLRASVTARDIYLHNETAITVTIANRGIPSTPTEATVTVTAPNGTAIQSWTVDVQALDSGEVQVNESFRRLMTTPGEYTVRVEVVPLDTPNGTVAQTSFTVQQAVIDGVLEPRDSTTSNETTVRIPLTNTGTVRSDSVTVTVDVLNASGTTVNTTTVSVPSLPVDGHYNQTVPVGVPSAGTFTAIATVDGNNFTLGSVSPASFSVTWPDHRVSVSRTEAQAVGLSSIDVTVDNAGPGPAPQTNATLTIISAGGEQRAQQQITIPALESGTRYQDTLAVDFPRAGDHRVELSVNDTEYPRGNTDTTGLISLTGSDLVASISTDRQSVSIEGEVSPSITVTNTGTEPSESTTVHLRVYDSDGNELRDISTEIGPLDPGETTTVTETVQLSTSGELTLEGEVIDEQYPGGTVDTTTVDVLSPDLRATISATDTQLNEETTISLSVENVGELQSDATEATVTIYNQNGNRVTRDVIEVESLQPGGTMSTNLIQLVHEDCWRTEMSCLPGASVAPGTYTVEIDVSTAYAPQGSVAEAQFEVTPAD